MIRAVIFDGDDTLWRTEWLYDDARRHAREIVEGAGLDGEQWETRERLTDVENVERFGHSTERFPASCVEAYEETCAAEGKSVDRLTREKIHGVAAAVFTREAPLVEGVQTILEGLRSRGLLLALLTKGDLAVQRRRVEQSGLAPLLDLVEIVEKKTPESILATLSRLGVDATEGLTVGNSVRSDVLPSLVAGVTPVWIDAHVWEYERNHGDIPLEHVIKREDLSDLLQIELA